MNFASIRRSIWMALALVFTTSGALANGRFPATNAVVVQPGNAQKMALRATYGLLLSNDAGKSWDWVCERAIGFSGNEDPSIVLSANGTIVVGAFNGIARSSDGGCHFSRDASWPEHVVDLTTRPSAADRVYAATNSFSKMSDAGTNIYSSELFVSEDAGAHWSSRAKFDSSLLIDSIEVAPSDSKRVYVSAARDSQGVLLVSDDDGAHWKQLEIKLISHERGVYIAAVDAKNAARIYVRTASSDASRLLVSDDAGVSFRELLHGPLLQGFALADDGATIFAGDASGLFRADSNADRFERVSTTPIQCLTAIGKDLWACAPTGVGYVLGASSDRGATFSPKLAFDGIRGELQCASPSAMDVCADDWSALQSLARPTASNALDAATTTANATSREKHSMLSCSSQNAPASKSPVNWLVSAFAIALVTARRARKKIRS